ncbi:protein Abitram [Drosophila hydei]|uniref:Protein Abitram n=1 Tax=Drosophila hydei TaxID=7224 RepID=A0A6J1LA57_DROHY|nr:protein Abitram [Drosophila hydei]
MPPIEAGLAEEDPFAPYYFQHEEQKICGELVSSITDCYTADYPSVVDRFFTRYYYIKGGAPYQVLYHSNRICLICLAPTHPAFSEGIASVSYDVGNIDRSQNVVKGKAKKGGMILQADTTLALLTTETGTVYKIPSCIRGKLVEVNNALQTDAKQLQQAPEGAGYFAILLPKIENCDDIKANLLSQQQFEEQLKNVET